MMGSFLLKINKAADHPRASRHASEPSRFFAIKTAFIFATTLLPLTAQAEYRAFQLVITNTKTNQSRLVLTTLDDIQYPGYHPLNADESIAIQDSWRCWERSDGFKDICPNPRPASETRAPANAAPGGPTSPSAKSSGSAL